GNLVRQTLDLDRSGDDLEQPALDLDALRLAGGMHRRADADAFGKVDTLQVGVQQSASDRIDLMVYDHDGSSFPALHSQAENRVVPRVAVDDFEDFAR